MNPLFVVLMTLNITSLAAFQWGRMRYFRRLGDDRVRGGLGPFGTIFAVIQFPLVWMGGLASDSWRIAVVIVLYACALILFFWAARSHAQEPPGIAFTPGAPRVLVTNGAYQLARHPFYLSYLLFWMGVAVIAPLFSGVPIFIVMLVLYRKAAVLEEADIMSSPLFEEYDEYRRQVGMFFRWP